MDLMDIISNCPLCEEHALHIVGEEEAQIMQCIHCGYVSSTSFLGKRETNETYKGLAKDMKSWSKEYDGRIWIPSIMTLPVGMLYPIDKEDKVMKWAYAKMKDIPKEEQKNFPDGNGGFYERKIDTDNATIYDEFFEGMLVANNRMKESSYWTDVSDEVSKTQKQNKTPELKLPKLKKAK